MNGLKEVTLYEVSQRKVFVDGDVFTKVKFLNDLEKLSNA